MGTEELAAITLGRLMITEAFFDGGIWMVYLGCPCDLKANLRGTQIAAGPRDDSLRNKGT